MNPAMRTQRHRINNQPENLNYDMLKTTKIGQNQFKAEQNLNINGVKVRRPEHSMNPFDQTILDIQVRKKSGITRLDPDLQLILFEGQSNVALKPIDIMQVEQPIAFEIQKPEEPVEEPLQAECEAQKPEEPVEEPLEAEVEVCEPEEPMEEPLQIECEFDKPEEAMEEPLQIECEFDKPEEPMEEPLQIECEFDKPEEAMEEPLQVECEVCEPEEAMEEPLKIDCEVCEHEAIIEEPMETAKSKLILQNQNFLKAYSRLTKQFLSIIDHTKSLFRMQKWSQIFEPLDGAYLTINQRIQLMKNLYYLIKVELGIPFEPEQQQVHLLSQKYSVREFCFCEDFADKFLKLKAKIKDRKSHTIQVMSFMKDFTMIKMDFSELSDSVEFTLSENQRDKKVDQRVFDLCKRNPQAFSLFTLYLSNCINTQLQKTPEKVFDLADKLKQLLKSLSKKYPINSKWIQSKDLQQDQVFPLVIDQSYQIGKVYIPTIKLKKAPTIDEKVIAIESEIIRKAIIAKSNKEMFEKAIRPICEQYGKNYQSGLKIQSDTFAERFSKYRAFKTIVYRQQNDCLNKFNIIFENEKQPTVDILVKGESFKKFNKIHAINQECHEGYHKLRNQSALNGREQISFKVMDLLRAKAFFQRPSQIIKTANTVHKKFYQMQSGYYSMLQYENRLDQQSKDFKLHFLINGTISELQLVLGQEEASSPFNCKLRQFQRCEDLTPLMTLQSINEQIASKFFIEQLQLCCYFEQDLNELKNFEQILANNVESHTGANGNLERLIFSKDRSNFQIIIGQLFNKMAEYIEKKQYNKDRQFNRDALRESNSSLRVTNTKQQLNLMNQI